MTFQDINFGRVIQAIMFTFGVTIGLYLLTSCAAVLFVDEGMIERFQDISTRYGDYFSSPDPDGSRQAELESELRDMFADYQDQILSLLVLFCGQSFVMLGVTFWFARRAALGATSRAQANGYGLLIGLGVALVLATICLLINPASLLIGVFFLALVVLAAFIGGWQGGLRLTAQPASPFGPGSAPLSGTFARPASPLGGDARIYFDMGVTAAMGGRREEARQHFTRVLQYEPRNIAAWLQLANLADDPAHAWEYIEQARAISPNDPGVVQAVNVIGPQVKDQVARPAPRNQPPYRGGAMDDTDIPRTTLPDLGEPAEIHPPDSDDGPPA